MEKDKPHFKEYIWLFIIGSVGGFLIETFWHYYKYGHLINKQGLLYGPFKPIYGFGLVIIISLMYRFKNKSLLVKFILGSLIGSIYEYLGSLFQEIFFGTSTWNYLNFNWNLNGRIYLPYCLIWGVFAIVSLDFIYPFLKRIIKRINPKIFSIITYIIGLFMFFNILLTSLAIIRYSGRIKGESLNPVFKIIDENYNDEYMQKKFPRLKIIP